MKGFQSFFYGSQWKVGVTSTIFCNVEDHKTMSKKGERNPISLSPPSPSIIPIGDGERERKAARGRVRERRARLSASRSPFPSHAAVEREASLALVPARSQSVPARVSHQPHTPTHHLLFLLPQPDPPKHTLRPCTSKASSSTTPHASTKKICTEKPTATTSPQWPWPAYHFEGEACCSFARRGKGN